MQRAVLDELHLRTGLPAWIVIHDRALTAFVLLDLADDTAQVMDEPRYRRLLGGL